jgi:hypothetical protein
LKKCQCAISISVFHVGTDVGFDCGIHGVVDDDEDVDDVCRSEFYYA